MKPFAALLDRLLYTPSRNARLALLEDYFRRTPDPDRGIGLAALTGDLSFANAKPAMVRALVAERVDEQLFAWSYDFVGDLAETTSLVWPARRSNRDWPRLSEVAERLDGAKRSEVPALMAEWLDALDTDGRWALLKLVTGGLRVGVSARLARLALAGYGKVDVAQVEELWHGLAPPYERLFAWLEGRGPRPDAEARAVFRPLMLANPLDDGEAASLDLSAFAAEWKWDGIRVQIAARGGETRLYSRGGDDIGRAFPEIVDAVAFDGVLDGELLVVRDGAVAPFNDLQQRLGRKTVNAKLLAAHPAHVRLYDILFDGGEDLRQLPFAARRTRLEDFARRHALRRMDVSPLVAVGSFAELDALRQSCRGQPMEGLMLKRLDSAYVAGRPKGPWFKWKRDPLTADCVVMYAQRGHGKRSSYYSDFTFGAWREGEDGPELVPVGKAYSGYTDDELMRLDKWVREHTTDRFGPVREVEPELVVEVAFDAVGRSSRHKSGLAMRFPRFHRIRWEKPAEEADRVDTLERWAE